MGRAVYLEGRGAVAMGEGLGIADSDAEGVVEPVRSGAADLMGA